MLSGRIRGITGITRLALAGLLLASALAGCDWEGRNEIALRRFPYPYEAGIALVGDLAPGAVVPDGGPLAARGVRFVDGREVVHTIGQDSISSLVDRGRQLFEFVRYGFAHGVWRPDSFFGNRLVEPWNGGPETGPWSREREGAQETVGLPPGGRGVYSFKTYVGRWGRIPGLGSDLLDRQLSELLLYELRAKTGTMLLEAHLGDDAGPAPAVLSALRTLKQEHEEGRIYVTTPGRLLAGNLIHRSLEWEADRKDGRVDIRILTFTDETGLSWIPAIDELRGVTFYTPLPENTRILMGDTEIGGILVNPPDKTRRASVSVPLLDSGFPERYLVESR